METSKWNMIMTKKNKSKLQPESGELGIRKTDIKTSQHKENKEKEVGKEE